MNHTTCMAGLLSVNAVIPPQIDRPSREPARQRLLGILPESLKSFAAIALSLVAGVFGMSALFGILMAVLAVPAVRTALGTPTPVADCASRSLLPETLMPRTNAVFTTATSIALRDAFGHPAATPQKLILQFPGGPQPSGVLLPEPAPVTSASPLSKGGGARGVSL